MTVIPFSNVNKSAGKDLHPVPAFDDFWAAWPKRVAKKDARRAWDKLNAAAKLAVMVALPKHIKKWQQESTPQNYIPHPATWLNGERWEDEFNESYVAPVARNNNSEPAWWSSHVLMERKGIDVGVGAARPGETSDQYRARIHAAIQDQERFKSAM